MARRQTELRTGSEQGHAVLYARVSTEEQAQEGFSTEFQERNLEDHAKKHGLTITRRFVEAQSASKLGRVEFAKMVAFAKENPRTTILVDKTDRLTRNLSDMVLINELIRDYSARLVVVRENISIDRDSNSTDRFMLSIMGTMANHFSNNLSEEVKKGMVTKAKSGIFPSNAPIGYLNVLQNGRKVIMPDPDRASVVTRLFEEYANGMTSLSDLSAFARVIGLRTRKGQPLATSSIHRMLENPIYIGLISWGNVEARGIHEALISEDTFRKCQAIMHGRANNKTGFGSLEFAYRGLFQCGHCGCNMTAERKKKRYLYYHCTGRKGPCPGKAVIREEEITAQVSEELKSLMIPDEIYEPLKEALKESLRVETGFREDAFERHQKREAELKGRKARLYDHFADGIVDRATYDLKRQEIDAELDEIRVALGAVDRAETALFEDGVTLLDLARGASETFLNADPQERREILASLGSNSTIKDGRVVLNLREPFATIWKMSRTQRFEHSNEPGEEVWYSRRDSNPRSSP